MPKVTKKTSRKSSKKNNQRSSRHSKSESLFDTLSMLALRYRHIAAGLGLIIVITVSTLWASGHVGLLGERVAKSVDDTAIALGMDITRITAKGLDKTNESEILAALGPVIGASMISFDAHAARARVEDLGWVRVAAISRLWPDTVHISIRERTPAAVWQLSGDLHLIDQTGAIIREVDAYEFSNLPLIVGAGAPGTAAEILQALRKEPALWGVASALIRVGDRRWNMRLKSGADIKFPEEDIETAISELASLHAAYRLLDRDLEYIDLRNSDHLIYREKNAEESALSDL